MSQSTGIKDIAKRAGVSTATVSRTLRNPELVSDNTREKVMIAVKAGNYRPNQMGSNLRTKRSGNIVAIIPDITNPFNAGVIRSIEQVAQAKGYCVLLGDTQGDEDRIRHYAAMVASRQADGIILFSQFMPFEQVNGQIPLEKLPPLVNSCEDSGIEGINKVMIDNKAAAVMAVEHLLGLGHTRIACITGPEHTNSTVERLAGYKQALKNAGIAFDQQLVQVGDHQVGAGIEKSQQLLLLKDRPTAIFCFNDEMAIGAMSALQQLGYQVPNDISIMGFDDIRFAQFTSPSLTTIRQPVEQIGRECMNMLIKQMEQPNGGVDSKQLGSKQLGSKQVDYVELPVTLVVRDSTAAVKG